MSKALQPHQALLENVRISYPSLFTAKAMTDKHGRPQGEAKYSAAFLMHKERNEKSISRCKAAIEHVKKEKWGDEDVYLKHTGLRDGKEKADKDGYGPEIMFVNASNEKRPQVVQQDPSIPITATDNLIEPGYNVNAVVSFFAYQNEFGKGIGVKLMTVQLHSKNEVFGERVEATEVFGNVAESEEVDPLA